jgi:hypothetical protein
MLRRIAALLLIATSTWLLFQTRDHFLDGGSLLTRLTNEIDNPYFFGPAIGGVLGLAGGLIAFFGGVGGATIAFLGGLTSAGLAVYLGQQLMPPDFRIWESETSVGVTILALAAIAASMGRD